MRVTVQCVGGDWRAIRIPERAPVLPSSEASGGAPSTSNSKPITRPQAARNRKAGNTASVAGRGVMTLPVPAMRARQSGPRILPTPFAACPMPIARAASRVGKISAEYGPMTHHPPSKKTAPNNHHHHEERPAEHELLRADRSATQTERRYRNRTSRTPCDGQTRSAGMKTISVPRHPRARPR